MMTTNSFICNSTYELESIFFKEYIESYQISEGHTVARVSAILFGNYINYLSHYKTAILSEQLTYCNKITFILIVDTLDLSSKIQNIPIEKNMIFCLDGKTKIHMLLKEDTKLLSFHSTREEIKILGLEYIINTVIYPREKRSQIISKKIIKKFNTLYHLSSNQLKDLNSKNIYEDFLSLYLYLFLNKDYLVNLSEKINNRITSKKIFKYIVDNGNNKIKVKILAKILQKSERTLERNFKKEYNITIEYFIKIYRLHLAQYKLLLRLKKYTITEIAFDSGFTHLGRFSENYKKFFGKSPSEIYKNRD